MIPLSTPHDELAFASLRQADNIVLRLQLLIKYLSRNADSVIACSECRQPLATKQQMFTVRYVKDLILSYRTQHDTTQHNTYPHMTL